jgi:hypothetical protein
MILPVSPSTGQAEGAEAPWFFKIEKPEHELR